MMRIEPATMHDVEAVVATYAYARTIQLARSRVAWLGFTAQAIRELVDARQLFCVRDDAQLTAVFVVLDEDPAIWDDEDARSYLYLHRVARAEACGTPGIFGIVLEWTRSRCRALGRIGIRMDTWAENDALLSYYERFGFRLVGERRMPADPKLPQHYHGITLALLEQRVAGPGESPLMPSVVPRADCTLTDHPREVPVSPRRRWFDRSFPPGHALDELPEIVERLRGTPARLEERIASFPSSALTRPVDERWSIQEHVGHLLDLETLWAGRLDDIEAGASALRAADLTNRATDEARHNERSIAELLAGFRERRMRLVERVEAMPTRTLQRTANHPRLQHPMTVVDLCFFVAEHDDHHLATMTELTRAS